MWQFLLFVQLACQCMGFGTTLKYREIGWQCVSMDGISKTSTQPWIDLTLTRALLFVEDCLKECLLWLVCDLPNFLHGTLPVDGTAVQSGGFA